MSSDEERVKGGFILLPVSLKFYYAIGHRQENLPQALACGKELGIKKAFPLVLLAHS